MANLISSGEWAAFDGAMQDASDTFALKPCVWKRRVEIVNRFGEDQANTFEDITLNCLVNYNWMRSWPVTLSSDTGDLDRESIQVMFKKTDLIPYIVGGVFQYNTGLDRFLIDGLIHKAVGDTPVSQTRDTEVWFTIIMKREETETGENR